MLLSISSLLQATVPAILILIQQSNIQNQTHAMSLKLITLDEQWEIHHLSKIQN